MKKLVWTVVALLALTSSSEAGIFHRHKEPKQPKSQSADASRYNQPGWGRPAEIFKTKRVHLVPYIRNYGPPK